MATERRLLIPARLSAAAEAGPEPGSQWLELGGESMGTRWSAKLCAASLPSTTTLQLGLQAELDRVVVQMSPWCVDSDISRYNRAAAGSWHALPADFCTVMAKALSVAAASQGAYDPSAGALVDCWGFGPAPARQTPPSAEEIAVALATVGWQKLRLADGRLLQPGGTRLDLSAIAKGYGVDLLAGWLRGQGIAHFLVEVGGELRGQGCKPDGSPWWVALETPGESAGAPLWLALDGLSVATSGDYRRYFESEGRRYAHTLDPRRGQPPVSALVAVSVVHADCAQADAESTAITVLGWEQGQEYARRLGLAARLLRARADGFQEWLSPTLEAMLE